MILETIYQEDPLKFIITIFVLTCLSGCNPIFTNDSVTTDPSSSPIPKLDTMVASATVDQGFTGHVYAYYTGPAPLCESDVCPTSVPMRSPIGGIHMVVVDPDMQEILAETVSLEDGSYRLSLAPGTYHVCRKWETGMTCNSTDSVPPNTNIVEDFDVGQG